MRARPAHPLLLASMAPPATRLAAVLAFLTAAAPAGAQAADPADGRGIDGLHLVHDGGRWWITHATWENRTPERPIPGEDLPDG